MVEFVTTYWLEVAFGGVLTVLGCGVKKLTKKVEEQESIRLGMQAILRDRLIQSYNYHMDKGCCAIHDRDNIINMYNQYHTLGANGVIDDLMKELFELPVATKNC